MKHFLLTLLLAAASQSITPAAEPQLYLAERGKLLLSDDFNQAPETKGWRVAKGKWEVADGGMRGAEVAEDKHPGVTRHALAFTNAIFQFDARLDGCKMATLSINDA